MYTSIKEVEIVRNSEVIKDAYESAFEARYHTRPFVEFEDNVTFSFLSKNFGKEKGVSIARHYLKMQDEWFLKNAHSASVLRKNVAKVVADLGVVENRRRGNSGIMVALDIACDACGSYFRWIVAPENIEGRRICPSCEAKGRT